MKASAATGGPKERWHRQVDTGPAAKGTSDGQEYPKTSEALEEVDPLLGHGIAPEVGAALRDYANGIAARVGVNAGEYVSRHEVKEVRRLLA